MGSSIENTGEVDSRIHNIVEKLRRLEYVDKGEIQDIIGDMLRLQVPEKTLSDYHLRINSILEVLLRFTVLDFSEKAMIGESGDEIDAIAIGINTLAEELEDKIATEKQNAQRLKAQNVRLEKINKELASFAYVSSHDLQEPLRKINTYISRILDEFKESLPGNSGFYFERIASAATRMQKLIRDILEYSALNTTEEKVETADLNTLMKDVLEDLNEVIEEGKARIEYHFVCEVKIVPFQFKRLLSNLLGNSVKFRSNERPLLVNISSRPVKKDEVPEHVTGEHENYCHLTYSDNGVGFENRFSERIFEVFQRLHTQSDYQGTGIGLAICKRIVENHDGAITAAGEPGKGATFHIYLPV